MASPELEAFFALETMGMVLEGEYFSPSKAQNSYYTQLLEAAEKIHKKTAKPPAKN